MFEITKSFQFSASHQLDGLPEGHKCARLHGHNYEVILTLRSPELDAVGFVCDYGDLKAFGRYLDSTLDHRHLNDVLTANPTAERLADHLLRAVCAAFPWGEFVYAVTVKETPGTSATCYR